MQTACREYTHSRNLTTSRPRGWIRLKTKISPVLDVKLYPHEGRYCIGIMIESLFKDPTVSWVRIVNGINKYVTKRSCFEVSKFVTRTLRHEPSVLREEDGAARFHDLIEKLRVKFAGTLQWTVKAWVNSLAKHSTFSC